MIFNEEMFKDKHILITGASGGIGEKTAILAAKYGANISMTGRNEQKLSTIKNKCLNEGVPKEKVAIICADITTSKDREHIVAEAKKHHGVIHGLVNSAGISGGDTLENTSENDLRQIMELNYTATVLLTQLVYKQMKPHQTGAIVNVSSLSGLRGTYGNTAYSASKFALIGFTHSFALEAIEHNIRVNAVCPGFVNTEMAKNIIAKKAKKANRTYEDQLSLITKALPSGRITEPEEVANSILFLLSPAATNIVGESMKISGGSVMR
ncbi:SDR family oxidoreductase [Bacillus sp. A116_S68]|nr:SDR family oxidoreductase [Bacillus sp. A116_S68]